MSELLWSGDAVALVELLRTRQVTPQEVLDSFEARVSAVDPQVNALPTLCFERARNELATRSAWHELPLGGLPVPIKDSYPVAGVRTTFGSRVFENHVPERSDFLVEAIEASGGV